VAGSAVVAGAVVAALTVVVAPLTGLVTAAVGLVVLAGVSVTGEGAGAGGVTALGTVMAGAAGGVTALGTVMAGAAGGVTALGTVTAGAVGFVTADVAEPTVEVAEARGAVGLGVAAKARLGTAATVARSDVATAIDRKRLARSPTS
jgi:hypothetical protein